MSDPIRHECGVAMVRLRKPLSYYAENKSSVLDGFHKLFLLMEKQHNRGHDGFGIGSCKLDMPLGTPYLFRERSSESDSLATMFKGIQKQYRKQVRKGEIDESDPESVKAGFDFGGEVLLGHLRYSTSGAIGRGACHPYMRRSNWATKSLMVLGNFNMANFRELNQVMINRGQHPVFETDTQTVLEEIGYYLDEAHTEIYRHLRDKEPGAAIPHIISKQLDVPSILRQSASIWDGGYSLLGVIGNGDAFAMRDPNGIRPCFYTVTSEYYAFASERAPLMTVFDVNEDEVHELPPGNCAVIDHEGFLTISECMPPRKIQKCSFESIYFSRGNDPLIYQQRKRLGAQLLPQILSACDDDMRKAVLSFIPNTAEIGYLGLMEAFRAERIKRVKAEILEKAGNAPITPELLDGIFGEPIPRTEKVAHKDIKLRTFISQEESRLQLASHVYDITYGVVKPDDYLVALDDSIVRGTTLRQSILRILARANPKGIIVASTAPQIRYPDCYGIDMSEMGRFIAFQAAVDLLKTSGRSYILDETATACRAELLKPASEQTNVVKSVYAPFTSEAISERIAQLVYPEGSGWKGKLTIVYQKVDKMHVALGKDYGDWYFTGDYPTPAGTATANQAFLAYYDNVKGRAYDFFQSTVS